MNASKSGVGELESKSGNHEACAMGMGVDIKS